MTSNILCTLLVHHVIRYPISMIFNDMSELNAASKSGKCAISNFAIAHRVLDKSCQISIGATLALEDSTSKIRK